MKYELRHKDPTRIIYAYTDTRMQINYLNPWWTV